MENYDFDQYIYDVWEASFDDDHCALKCLQETSASLSCNGTETELGACLCSNQKFLNDASCCTWTDCPTSATIDSAKDVLFVLNEWCYQADYENFEGQRDIDCPAKTKDSSSSSNPQPDRRDNDDSSNSPAGTIVGVVVSFIALAIILAIVGTKIRKQKKRAARQAAKNSQRYRASLGPSPLLVHSTIPRPPPVRAQRPRPSRPPPPPPYSASAEAIPKPGNEPPRYEA